MITVSLGAYVYQHMSHLCLVIGVALACCAECFVGCIEGLVSYFNRYAYIEIALYGKPYIGAAKDTWHLLTDRGVDALVNDSLVGIVIQWGAYVVGALCSLGAYLYLRYTAPSYNAGGQYTAPVVLFSFLIGAQCLLTLGVAIEAGVSTIFVGLGEDPQVLAQRAPQLFGVSIFGMDSSIKLTYIADDRTALPAGHHRCSPLRVSRVMYVEPWNGDGI
jgi:hypothetical protein